MTRVRRNLRPAWLLPIIVLSVGAYLFVPAVGDILAQARSYDATVDLGSYGPVTIRLKTDPNPPVTTGSVELSLIALGAGKRPVALDRLSYTFARSCDDAAAGSGEAQPMGDTTGMWMGAGRFPAVGTWCLVVTARKGTEQATARLLFEVERPK